MSKDTYDDSVISIGLPVYNGADSIKEAIDSILAQSFNNWELIVSDNNSSDSTVEIVEEFVKLDKRIYLFKQKENIGIYPNFHFVLKKSKGKYFHWLGADDQRSTNFLQDNFSFLNNNPDFVASCSEKFFGSVNNSQKSNVNFALDQLSVQDRFKYFLDNAWQSHSIYFSVIRTELIKECKFLGENYLAHDWIIDLFLARHGKVALQTNSYIILGEKGISRTEPFKQFRTNWIESLFPLYTFHKKFNILIDKLNFIVKCALTFKVLGLHFQLIKLRTVVFIKKNVLKKKY